MKPAQLAAYLVTALLLAGCGAENRAARTSVMEYLYPAKPEAPAPDPRGANLRLPVDVGIAFLPRERGWARSAFAVEDEVALLERVRATFHGKDWVRRIQIVPSLYLTTSGGFAEMEQIARLFAVDVLVMVSIDQVQVSHDNPLALTYLTIAGAFLIPGNNDETRTFVDAAVFAPETRTFLLRAPGRDRRRGMSTGMGVDGSLAHDAHQGMAAAMAEMTVNLEREVDAFATEVRAGQRTDVEIADRQGVSLRQGGGIGGWYLLIACAALAVIGAPWTRWR